MSSDTEVFDRLLERVRGHQLASLIHLAVRWDLADLVGDGQPIAALATRLGVEPRPLSRMVRALAAFEIFRVDAADAVWPTAASRFLRRDAPKSLHAAASFWGMGAAWSGWGALEHAVRTGESSFEHLHDRSLFEHLADNERDADGFNRFMAQSPESRHAAVVGACDFRRFGTIADIGGGNGELMSHVLRASPTSRGILFDRADVVERSAANVRALAEFGHCEAVAGDFFAGVPAGAEAYILSQILHDWPDADAVRILKSCRDAMARDARLIVIERVLGPQAHWNDFLSDIEMLVLHSSAERTVADFATLLRHGGFEIASVVSTQSHFSVLECIPA